MTVTVLLRVVRRAALPDAADAFLLFADGYAPLAAACATLGGAAGPDVYPLRGGFVLVPREASSQPVPGAVRLRRVSGDLFVPADADLIPALLPDEVAALTADRGLVVLPGGTVLAFDPRSPLPVSRWLAPTRVRRADWQPLPPRLKRAERLTVIERPTPPGGLVELLGGGQPDDTESLPGAGEGGEASSGSVPEAARPPGGSLRDRVAAGTKLGVGRVLAWLGKHLAAPGLARLGGKFARKALEQVPRLSEKLLGAQEAALREVLRQLRSGEVEAGLRRAPVAVPDPDAAPPIGTTANLGTRDPRYSLRDLIGAGGGAGAAWLGGGDVWAQLAQEYRRLAQEAAARGDHRRAAYLYGVLLRDPRAAANALMRGGLFRDAARLYRDRLNDDTAAAAAFEQAGDYDEAVRLFDRLGEYERAGDVLRRLGDDSRAAGFFARAADRHAESERWVAAGDLVRIKAGDRAAAARYYRAGWANGRAEAVACGERLLHELVNAEQWGEADALFAEAERLFAPPRAADAARFFNTALTVGDTLPPDRQDDLADRARRLFAAHLRAGGGRATALVGELFGRRGVWPGPVVRDAAAAARPVPRPAAPPPPVPPVSLLTGPVTAVAVARDGAALVVASSGQVVAWFPDGHYLVTVGASVGRVVGLSSDPSGGVVYVLSLMNNSLCLRCYLRTNAVTYQPSGEALVVECDPETDSWYLQPAATAVENEPGVTFAGPRGRIDFTGPYLRPGPPDRFAADGRVTHLLALDAQDGAWDWDERFVRYLVGSNPPRPRYRWVPHWTPARAGVRPVDYLTPAPGVLEVTGVDAAGVLHWAEFDGRLPGNPQQRAASETAAARFVTACLVSPGVVVAATECNTLSTFRVAGGRLQAGAATTFSTPARIAALAGHVLADAVVVVFEDGSVGRVPRP